MPYGGGVEAVLALLALAAVWVISRRSALTIGATAAVIGGLLVSHHAYVYDAALLLPACALVLRLPGASTHQACRRRPHEIDRAIDQGGEA